MDEESRKLVKQLREQAVASIHEVIGEKNALDEKIKPLAKDMKLCGRAKTVKCAPNDNLTLIKAIHEAQADEVIVIDMGDEVNAGPFGEVLSVECLSKHLGGLVTSGSVRDTAAIIKRGFPVFSAGISVRGTYKNKLGEIDVPVTVGGVIVNPGDYVLGDADGVVVVSPDEVQQAIVDATNRENKEAEVMKRLQAGESLYNIYGYDEKIKSMNK